jgi:hypothetical protein
LPQAESQPPEANPGKSFRKFQPGGNFNLPLGMLSGRERMRSQRYEPDKVFVYLKRF